MTRRHDDVIMLDSANLPDVEKVVQSLRPIVRKVLHARQGRPKLKVINGQNTRRSPRLAD